MSINHTVRRTGSGDYACSCGQTWDYDQGAECPAGTEQLRLIADGVAKPHELFDVSHPSIEAPATKDEWQCSNRGIEVPVKFLRNLSACLDKQYVGNPELQTYRSQLRHLLSQVPE